MSSLKGEFTDFLKFNTTLGHITYEFYYMKEEEFGPTYSSDFTRIEENGQNGIFQWKQNIVAIL